MRRAQREAYLFVIDTDAYSGNFNREMAAYITGRWDLVTHGGDQAIIANAELTLGQRGYFENHNIELHREVDDGHYDVNSVIWPTPGWFNDGHGNYFHREPTTKDLAKCYQRAAWPAYQSVGIFFNERPPEEMVSAMVDRAKAFVKYWEKKPKPWAQKIGILGFRIVLETIATHETTVWEGK